MTQQAAILESIRDIIAGKENPDDDVLDLTKKVNDDGSVTDIKAKAPAPEPGKTEEKAAEPAEKPPEKPQTKAEEKPAAKGDDKEDDILSEIDALLNDGPKPEEKPVELELAEITPEPAADESFTETPVETATAAPKPEPAAPAPQIQEEKPAMTTDAIISEQSANTAKSSISTLVSKIDEAHRAEQPGFRNGQTIEDLVSEMLRPLMKEWLDANLPKLVNQVVEREIAKIMANR